MIRLILILCFIFLALPFLSTTSQAITIAGDDAYPPYSYKEKGKLTGIYTDVITAALKKMGETHKLIGLPWKRGLSDLERKKIEALYPPYSRPQQRPYMSYSTDILDERLVIFCNKEKAVRMKAFPDDYQGIILGKNAGFALGEAVDAAVNAGILKVSEVKGMQGNLKKLVAGRIDCYANDRLSILSELKKMQVAGEYDGTSLVETNTLSIEKGYLAINNLANEKVKAFLDRFNTVIRAMKDSGEIEKIIKRYTD